jgi:hypothetical protein
MSELIDFAAQLIELEGGAVERAAERAGALLPESLSNSWHVAEELVLSEAEGAAQRLAYGSELLERMLDTATKTVSVAGVRVDLPALRGSQVKAAAERWALRNGLVSVGDIRLCQATRLQLFALATLHGDEKREYVVSSVLAPWSGTEVPGFEEALMGLPSAGHTEPPALSEAVLAASVHACELRALAQAQAFGEGMTRRFERDRERIELYFEDLSRELDKRARKGKLDARTVADKRNALFADRAAKLEALCARFVLRIEVTPIALRAIEVESGFASLTLRRRKANRTLELEYDSATRRMVAPRCDGCSGAAPRPAVCDDALHLLCEACAPRAEGRLACAACKPRAPGAKAVATNSVGCRSHFCT